MGFGTLLIGYIIAFLSGITDIYFFGDIIGGCIMLWGMYRLSAYQKNYRLGIFALFAFLFISLVNAVLIVFGADVFYIVEYVLRIVKLIAAALVHYYLLTATSGLSLEADVKELSRSAKRNLVITYLYYVCSVLLNIAAMILEESSLSASVAYASYIIAFVGIITVVLNSWLIYQCFGMLCLESDLEYTPKRSRFEIINKMNDRIDKLDVLYHPETREEKPRRHKKKKK